MTTYNDSLYPRLNGVRDEGHDLHRLAEIVAVALLVNHLLVDLAGRYVVVALQGDVEKPGKVECDTCI